MKAKTLQWGIVRARRDRLKIVEPTPYQLQLDIDGARQLRKYGMQYAILKNAGLTKGWSEKIIPSRRINHVHITITTPNRMSLLKRICLQTILGSDPTREAFNFARAQRQNKYPVVFFEKDGEHDTKKTR